MIAIISTRVATVAQVASHGLATRTFSTKCEPALRLSQALADYKRIQEVKWFRLAFGI